MKHIVLIAMALVALTVFASAEPKNYCHPATGNWVGGEHYTSCPPSASGSGKFVKAKHVKEDPPPEEV